MSRDKYMLDDAIVLDTPEETVIVTENTVVHQTKDQTVVSTRTGKILGTYTRDEFLRNAGAIQ